MEQLDLDGGATPVAGPSDPPPTSPTLPPSGGQQLGLPVDVAVTYHAPAWGGTVTQPPLAGGEGGG